MRKVIGILGGLRPESTVTYYKRIVSRYLDLFGDYSYPYIVIYSVSFQKFVDWMAEENWDRISKELVKALVQ
jgi:aspartate racemase